VTAFYFNPNIAPRQEYDKRLSELERFASLKRFSLEIGVYDAEGWCRRVSTYPFCGEKSERCGECYRVRLEEAFKKAAELGIDTVATTLTVSPHKDSSMINRIGKELESSRGIEFIAGDFKKKDGYKRSVEISRQYGLYRQNYCGCISSRIERVKRKTAFPA
jgi:predicted adenine nucleotide alpha hydrolase (AANH) superfamily ATPase